jgi:hypothetical protein
MARSVVGLVGGTLLDDATSYLNGVAPFHYADFISNRMLYAGVDVGTVAGGTGYSFTRASVGTYRNADGTTTQFSSGQLRRGDRGVLIEGARTNLFLNSATGSTQSVTVAAAAHTLSFEGTGTVTLSGTSTAGPLVGTGALNRVSLTFTPTAGSLTLTITGTVERVNLEAGAFGSSWIPTTGSSATRAADVLTYTAGVGYPIRIWSEFEPNAVSTNQSILFVSDGTINNEAAIRLNTGGLPTYLSLSGGALQSNSTVGSAAANTVYKFAARFATNSVRGAFAGTLGPADTSATNPATPIVLNVGSSRTGTEQLFGYIRRIAVIEGAGTDADLTAMTTT